MRILGRLFGDARTAIARVDGWEQQKVGYFRLTDGFPRQSWRSELHRQNRMGAALSFRSGMRNWCDIDWLGRDHWSIRNATSDRLWDRMVDGPDIGICGTLGVHVAVS